MKPMIVGLLLGLGVSCAVAEPRLFVSSERLGPETELELILDRAAVPDEQVGKESPAAGWIEIRPALAARLAWKAPNVARVLLDGVPVIGAEYDVSVPAGRQHLDGTPVPAGPLATLAAESLQIESGFIPNRYARGFSRRNAAHLLRFNDDVDPDTAARHFQFVDHNGRTVEARAWHPQVEELPDGIQPAASWSARFEAARTGAVGEPPAAGPCRTMLWVAPAQPLPVGRQWRLAGGDGLPNAAGNATTTSPAGWWIGDVNPFQLREIRAAVSANNPRQIVVTFSENLPEGADPAQIVMVTPAPADQKGTIDGNEVVIEGDLRARDKWRVAVSAGVESHDGMRLEKPATKEVEFKLVEASLALPSHDGGQLAHGSRSYRIETVNLASVKVRVKQLAGTGLLRTMQGYRHYSGDGPGDDSLPATGLLPWELIDAEPLLDLEIGLDNAIDTSREVVLDWDELLPGQRFANLFVDVRGTPKPELDARGGPAAQAIVQLTDLGVGWKLAPAGSLLYAFSCRTGHPLEGVRFEFFGEDAMPVGTAVSDADGLARVTRDPAARHLVARLGDDCFATAFDTALPTVGLWHFPVRYSWGEPQLRQRQVFLFSDRSLYRPGETVHLKGIIRTRDGNAVKGHEHGATRLVVTDQADREVLRRDLELSQHGSFDHSLRLPAGSVGTFTVCFEFAAEVDEAEALGDDDWGRRWRMLAEARFSMDVQVAEFRRNAFEVKHALAEPAPGAAAVSLDVNAAYYQGQPVARGKVEVWTRITSQNFYPDAYRDFLFGDHRSYDPWYWARYFGYQEDEYYTSRSDSGTSALELDEQGCATVTAALPDTGEPTTREVRISTQVTDANQQSLTETTEALVHPAAVYAGIGRIDRLARTGDKLEIPLVAVTHDGRPCGDPLEVTVTVTREVNDQVKIANGNGRSAVRNEAREVPVSTAQVNLDPARNDGRGTPFSFQPESTGRHIIAIAGADAEGRPFLTRAHVHVYGSKEFPWAYEDGVKIKLVAEKRGYEPGDTARVLVLSPIEGTALVTVEREDVLRSFRTELRADNPVIEIPLDHADAPNAFVSVLVVKGARDSARKHPEPQLRLGYCELTVANRRDRLAVEITATGGSEAGDGKPASFLPGDTVKLTGTVRHADGSPAAGAEVTVWAEDEGVLAVMGYENPDPMAFFYQPRELAIRSGTSLAMLMPESPEEQEFFNKGFWVGGGGDFDGDLAERMRRDFQPCAVWAPALVTAADGSFEVTFTAPDTLTRYRVLAVASHGTARFGNVESAVVVAKPLMLEPKPPRFALEGDHMVLPVTVQNASDYSGTWKLTLTQDGKPAVEEEVAVAAGKSATLAHAVAFDRSGEVVFQWSATPVAMQNRALDAGLTRRLSDAVEHRVPVDFPMPLLRAHRRVALDGGGAARDLLDGIDAALRDGRGEVELEIARSLLLEAGGAVDFLLQYPYGCLEQTTSALLPWLAVKPLRPVVPAFARLSEERVDGALRTGVERLLVMQRPDGGFSYWPDGGERVDWATSYAGLGLVLARNAGTEVPEAAIDALCNDLAENLRGLAQLDDPHDLEIAARALWVLALADQPQEAYRNQMIERMPALTRNARCQLALAVMAEATDGSHDLALSILRNQAPVRGTRDRWMRWNNDDALELLAWSVVAPGSEESTMALDKLLGDRSPYGHWRTTWANGWTVLGMAAYAETAGSFEESVAIAIDTPDGPRSITLNPENPTATVTLPLEPGMTLAASADTGAFVRVKVAAKPMVEPQAPVGRNGLEITRTWDRVGADGTLEPLDNPSPGDLILVSLRVTLPNDGSRYLIVEDRLPAIFETIDERFRTQAAPNAAVRQGWNVSHHELRDDRALFFLDWMPDRGTYTLRYLARCTLAGEATAPPAKVESMYDPENFALSASRRFSTR